MGEDSRSGPSTPRCRFLERDTCSWRSGRDDRRKGIDKKRSAWSDGSALVRRPAARVAVDGLDRCLSAKHDFNRIRDHGIGVARLPAGQLNFFCNALCIVSVLRLAASFGELLCTVLVAGLTVRGGGVLKTKFRLDLVPAGVLLFGDDATAVCDSRINKGRLRPAGVGERELAQRNVVKDLLHGLRIVD